MPKPTYRLTRTPAFDELRRAFVKMPARTREIALARIRAKSIDLADVIARNDAEALSDTERKTAAQILHDCGAAFMLSRPAAPPA